MAAKTHVTTDHDEIRRWVEERGGHPAAVIRTEGGRGEGDPGIIRIDFPGYSGEGSLEEIGWDDWFRKFDASNLAFVFQEETAGGQKSNFNKLVGRETAKAKARGGRTSRRAARGRTPAKAKRTAARKTPAKAKSAKKPAKKPVARRAKAGAKKSTTGQVRAKATASPRRGTAGKAKTKPGRRKTSPTKRGTPGRGRTTRR